MAAIASAGFIVSLDIMKTHLNVGGTSEDSWLDKNIASITKKIETYCRRTFVAAHYPTEYHDGSGKRGFLYVRNPPIICITGDSLIDMPCDRSKYPDGIPIKALVGKKDFYVYSYDLKQGKIVLGKVKRVWKSGRNKVYKVTYSWRGYKNRRIISSIRTTENHKFLLRNGTYKKLKYLKIGDSLTPFKTYGRERITIFDDRRKISESRFVLQELLNKKLTNKDNAHHIDENKLNNDPINLKLMTLSGHSSFHENGILTRFNKGENLGEKHPRFAKKVSFMCKVCNKELFLKPYHIVNRKCCSSDCSNKMSGISRRLPKETVICSICGIKKDIPKVNVKHFKYCSNICRYKGQSLFMKKNKVALGNRFNQTPKGYYNWLIGQSRIYKWAHPEIISRFNTKFPNEPVPLTNHKIISIEEVGFEDVYDAEVEKYHNFAVNGIIIHNSLSELNEDTNRDFLTATKYATNAYITYDDEGKVELLDAAGDLTASLAPVVFGKGQQNIKLVYTGGYVDIPEDVSYGASEWIAKLYHRRDKIEWNLGSRSKGDKSVSLIAIGKMPDDVREFINPYRLLMDLHNRRR